MNRRIEEGVPMERFVAWNQFQIGVLEAWLPGAYVLSMFIVAAFRSQRIQNPGAFVRFRGTCAFGIQHL
jgi:hypothetical protein